MTEPAHRIDCHTHLMTPKRIQGGLRWIRKIVPAYEALSPEVTAEDLLSDLFAAGAEAIFNFFYPLKPGESREINRWQRELAAGDRRVIAFASLHPGDRDLEGIVSEALDELGLAGFKFHPYVQDFEPLDERMEVVYQVLEERSSPLVMHTGFAEFYGRRPLTADVLEILRRHPGLTFVVAHLLYVDFPLEQWTALLNRYPGLYLDATNTLSWYPRDSEATEELAGFLESHSDRVMFGSDYPMGMDYPVAKLYRLVQDFGLSQETVEDICWRTAARLIGRDRLVW